ncbi:MFS transporter [Alloalcanivorax xenomutans]|uniref:MFS transporter n=1 Tax=Alloalcanivorax xenomutans TaxID=1094342 RepID=UPI003A7FF95C
MTRQQTGPLYFGWYIVAAATTITLLTVGMRMGIGPFFKPIAEDLGLSRTTLSTIVALGMLAYGIGMPVAGFLAQKYGSRAVLLLGTAIVVISSIWSVNATDPFSFFLAFGILLSLGVLLHQSSGVDAGDQPVVHAPARQGAVLSVHRLHGGHRRDDTAADLYERYGWQHTLTGFTVLFVLLVIPAALMIIRDEAPEHTDLLPGDSAGGKSAPPLAPLAQLTSLAAMRTLPFCKIALGLFACGFSMNLLGSHGVPMLTDHGFDPITAALGIGLIGLVAIPSTLVLGHLADQVPRRNLLAAIYLIRGLGFIGLMMVPSVWYLYAVAAVGGIVWAGSIALSSAILADVYGIRSVGVLYGWAYLGHQVGAMISSWLGGWGYETFGTHWVAFGSAAAILMVAGVVSLRLPDARFFPQAQPSRA